MKNIFSRLTILLSAAALLGSCNVLDLTPSDKYTDDAVWQSEKTFEAYVIGFYAAMKDASEVYSLSMTDAYSDIMKQTKWLINGAHNQVLLTPDYLKESDAGPFECWDTHYGRIRRHNEFLADAPVRAGAFSSDMVKVRMAEVRFIRAFLYSRLARVYGGVVLRDEIGGVDGPAQKDKARMTEAETWRWIVDQLKLAAADLPEKWDSDNFGRATKASAWALITRCALYGQLWDEVIDAAAQIKQSGAQLCDNYADLFGDYDAAKNKEVLFGVHFLKDNVTHTYDKNFRPTGDAGAEVLLCRGTPTAELADSYEMADGTKFDWNTHGTDPYTGREPRFYASILYNGAPWNGRNIETYAGGADGYVDFNKSDGSTYYSTTGYYVRKFLQENNSDYIAKGSTQYDPMLRYGEVLLNLAEALAQKDYAANQTAALDALNEIRDRVDLPLKNAGDAPDLDAFMELLRQERKVELAFEGHRFWDLKRWRLAESVLHGKQRHAVKITKSGDNFTYTHPNCEAGDKLYFIEKYYLPSVPKSERDGNVLFGPNNPGW